MDPGELLAQAGVALATGAAANAALGTGYRVYPGFAAATAAVSAGRMGSSGGYPPMASASQARPRAEASNSAPRGSGIVFTANNFICRL